jgi:hypothetical protein
VKKTEMTESWLSRRVAIEIKDLTNTRARNTKGNSTSNIAATGPAHHLLYAHP